jgi:hypothetical protein
LVAEAVAVVEMALAIVVALEVAVETPHQHKVVKPLLGKEVLAVLHPLLIMVALGVEVARLVQALALMVLGRLAALPVAELHHQSRVVL